MSIEPLNCPNCGAPLPDPTGRITVVCTHCQTVVRVVPSVAESVAPAPDEKPFTPKVRIAPELSAKLVKLLRAGRRLEAIELYRADSGVGPAEAKDVVDAIQAGLSAKTTPTGTVDVARIQQLLGERRRMYAIQLYREQTGVTLSQAVTAVDAIAAGREPPAVDGRLSGDDLASVRSQIERGNKIAAIKLYRERTGLGLKEAKDAVEIIARGGEPPVAAMARAMHNVPASVDLAAIQDLLRAGNKIEAIKQYRTVTGLGLKEAKDAVDAIAVSTPGVSPRLGPRDDYRGCVNVLLIIVLFTMCIFGGCGAVAQTTATYGCAVDAVKLDLTNGALLGGDVNAGYLVLSPGYSQSWDLDGSWRLSMDLFMPAWGSRGLGLLYLSARADDSGYTAARATLFKDFQRHVVKTWGQIRCD
jgi:ribosomal protein L7/L12